MFSVVETLLHDLPVVHGNDYQGLQRADYQRAVPVQAPCGKIVSAGGVTLTTSKPSWTLYDTDPERAWSREAFDRLGQLLRVVPAQLKQQPHAEYRVLIPYYCGQSPYRRSGRVLSKRALNLGVQAEDISP